MKLEQIDQPVSVLPPMVDHRYIELVLSPVECVGVEALAREE